MAKNFQNGRPMHRAAAFPYKKPFRNAGNNGGGGGPGFGGGPGIGGDFNQMMFNASQIPDNPGYMDFTNPSPSGGGGNGMGQMQQKKKNNKNKQKGKQQQAQFQHPQRNQQAQNNGVGNWNTNKGNQFQGPNMGNNNRFNNGNNGGGPRNFNNAGLMQNGPNRGRGMGPRSGPGPRGNVGMPPMSPHGFQSPMIPPMPPMGRGPMPPPPMGPQPPPRFLRRSGRMGPMPPIPPQIPPMIPPRMPRSMPPAPFNNAGKVKKPNTKVVKKVVKGKSTIKTLKNLVNQYPIEKPWVTAEIRAEHEKKIDIENRLKGNKNDELFAQFKLQRDKFVAMYETAREEYLKKEAAAVKAKDAKDKQTNNKTAEKEENKKEANAKK
ncbi:DNA-binding protein K10 [Eurosta solidaginis]|uniref:DNA-binding protein K10 n=1 Tax=Eurosta solidaginis TaxID=178769 RepID=UPI0035316EB8